MTIQVHVVSLTINHDVMTHFQPKLVDNSGGSRVGTQIEKDVLLPNHKAIVAIIQSKIHLAESDEAGCEQPDFASGPQAGDRGRDAGVRNN